jgi:SAM-dependent methyltransferase
MAHQDTLDAAAWQRSWDQQQAAYMPDREERFAAMLDAVEAVAGPTQAILDLAGGTGSISLRALRRLPGATTTVLDVDPVLLTIARASVDERSTVVTADLRTPDWTAALPRRDYDAVLTATALHWIDEERLRGLYAEVRGVLRPGGLFINADHMPDGDLPTVTEALAVWSEGQRAARWAGGALTWEAWWSHLAEDPALGPRLAERTRVFGGLHAAEFAPNAAWHIDALTAAGFREVGLIWRNATDAAITALR